jgi:hypothetical protein
VAEFIERVVDAVARKLGSPVVVDGDLLPAGARSVVARINVADRPESLVVKGYRADARENWVREVAALESLMGRSAVAPALVAFTDDPTAVVMEDVGHGPTLAGMLLGSDAAAARGGLIGWASALADLHASTWNDTTRFEAGLARLSAPDGVVPDPVRGLVERGIDRLSQSAATIGVSVGAAVLDELTHAVASLQLGPRVLSPSDVCPDNNVRTGHGTRLLDFEGASVIHPAWDVAYLRVPWPTCWCAWRLPRTLSDAAEKVYVERVRSRAPDQGSPIDWAAFDNAVTTASSLWAIGSVGFFLQAADNQTLEGDDPARPSPTMRARVQHDLRFILERAPRQLVAALDLAGMLLDVTLVRWGETPLPEANAFA